MRRLVAALVVSMGGAAALSTAAQPVSLEELEARLKREQAAEAARQAEATRKAEAARRAAASQATLVVRAEGDCSLLVNGIDKGRLHAGATTSVKVSAGQQLIECDSGDGRRAEAIETFASGEQRVVRLALPPPVRFVRTADGVRDNEKGIVWASGDNGSDTDWNNATSYCAGTGGSLPTVAQAQSLFDHSGRYTQQMSGQYGNWSIKPVTDLIQFSQGFLGLWTSERESGSSAFFVLLTDGAQDSRTVSSPVARAVCVRPRS